MADQFNILDAAILDWTDSELLTVGEVAPPRAFATEASTGAVSTSGDLCLTYFTAKRSEPITAVTVTTGGTAAAATPTLVRIGIYEISSAGAGTLVASTANDTALLAATFTAYSKALSATWNKRYGQRYAAGLIVVSAAAMPTISGHTPAGTLRNSELYGVDRRIAGLLAAQTDLPASFADGSLSAERDRWLVRCS